MLNCESRSWDPGDYGMGCRTEDLPVVLVTGWDSERTHDLSYRYVPRVWSDTHSHHIVFLLILDPSPSKKWEPVCL